MAQNRSETADRAKLNHERWQQILAAAAQIFAARGYEATTIRDVAESVGMLGGSLYYYIEAKEDLLYAIIDDFHREGTEEVDRAEQDAAAAGHADDPFAMLRAVCARHADMNGRNRTRSAVFYNDFRHLSPERKQHIVDSRRRHQRRIERYIEACQRTGEIAPDKDPHLTALAMLSMLNATNTWYHPENDTSDQSIGHFLADLLLDGLAVRSPEAPAATGRRPATRSRAATPVRTGRKAL